MIPNRSYNPGAPGSQAIQQTGLLGFHDLPTGEEKWWITEPSIYHESRPYREHTSEAAKQLPYSTAAPHLIHKKYQTSKA